MPFISRKQHRLRGYDYSLPGAYFVTICAAQGLSMFGSIREAAMRPSALGEIVHDEVVLIPTRFTGIHVDTWVLMPNHLHLLLSYYPPDPGAPPKFTPLGTLVGLFKAGVTRAAHRDALRAGPVWQRDYYDHVIRHEGALQRVREYIANNPAQWQLDRENPKRVREAPFYMWLEAYCRKLVSQAPHE